MWPTGFNATVVVTEVVGLVVAGRAGVAVINGEEDGLAPGTEDSVSPGDAAGTADPASGAGVPMMDEWLRPWTSWSLVPTTTSVAMQQTAANGTRLVGYHDWPLHHLHEQIRDVHN